MGAVRPYPSPRGSPLTHHIGAHVPHTHTLRHTWRHPFPIVFVIWRGVPLVKVARRLGGHQFVCSTAICWPLTNGRARMEIWPPIASKSGTVLGIRPSTRLDYAPTLTGVSAEPTRLLHHTVLPCTCHVPAHAAAFCPASLLQVRHPEFPAGAFSEQRSSQ